MSFALDHLNSNVLMREFIQVDAYQIDSSTEMPRPRTNHLTCDNTTVCLTFLFQTLPNQDLFWFHTCSLKPFLSFLSG